VASINNILNDSLWEMRDLTKSLVHNGVSEGLIYDLIEHECERVRKLCSTKFLCNDKKINLSHQMKTILLRVVQEFLQNSIKHAECKNITLVLHAKENQISLTLTDDGKGFDAEKQYSNGLGLKSMKTRIALLKGVFELESKVGFGTKITIILPL
jgi:signal transduction histidine kinase